MDHPYLLFGGEHSATTAFQQNEPTDARGEVNVSNCHEHSFDDRSDASQSVHALVSTTSRPEFDPNEVVQLVNDPSDDNNRDRVNAELKERIILLEAEVKANQHNRVTDEYRLRQDHYLAVHAKEQELHAKEEELIESKAENERLHYLLSEKESTIFQQNIELCKSENLQRNYDASIKSVITVEAERNVLQQDRNSYLAESDDYRRQATRLTEERDRMKSRLDSVSNSLVLVQSQRTQEMEEMRMRIEDLQRQRQDVDQSHGRVRMNIPHSNAQLKRRSPNSRSRTQSSDAPMATDSGIAEANSAFPTEESGRPNWEPCMKIFIVEPVRAPTCRNCKAVVDETRAVYSKCCFHRADSQPYQVWRTGSDSGRAADPTYRDHWYWPCCNILARKEPRGCLELPNHDLDKRDHLNDLEGRGELNGLEGSGELRELEESDLRVTDCN